ncbi:hypothetical protein LP52_24995 [Streptomonospora alba]|uniref:Uncharacterized protein n=1 Tax=Streptomonospora alba TaxID=183763 RepID=A0A0C2J4W6_9ACTN|nr:hypothetical protein [Streptomonospora alba]KIH96436.1 hypothetical protein LP52_24995 [Streptomonospora alba]
MAMRLRLLAGLGPRRAWNVLARITTAASGSAPAAASRMSRRGALGRTAAVAAAAGVFSGLRLAPAAAETSASAASDDWLARLVLKNSRDLADGELQQAWSSARGSANLRNLLEAELPDQPAGLGAARSSTGRGSGEDLKGVVHQIEGGGELTALLWQKDNLSVLFYEARQGQETTRRSMVLDLDEPQERLNILGRSEQEELLVPSGDVQTRMACSPGGCSGACYSCQCSGYDLGCLATCCGSCVAACAGGPQACVACATLYCAPCLGLIGCCSGSACQYRPSC